MKTNVFRNMGASKILCFGFIVLTGLFLVLAGCKDPKITQDFVAVTDITGVPDTVVAGTPLTLTSSVLPVNATKRAITWNVKNVGTTGATIAVGTNRLNTTAAGTVVVTATIVDGTAVGTNYIKDFTITVTPPFINVANITDVPTQTLAGTPLTLTGIVEPVNATNRTIVWTVIDAGGTGAVITGTNILETTNEGSVTVTAVIVNGTASGDYSKEFIIDVNDPITFVAVTGITDVPENAEAGAPLPLSGTVMPEDATYNTILWSVTDAGTTGAEITAGTNILNTTAGGTVTILATIENGTATGENYTQPFEITVIVPIVAVTGIVDVPTQTLAGTPLTLTGTVEPPDATNKTIVWTVFEDNGTGAVIFGGSNILNTATPGTVTVRATIEDGLAEDENYTDDFIIEVKAAGSFVAVGDITGLPINAFAGTPLPLTGTVSPVGATFKAISWSIADPGTTGAVITAGNILNTTASGTVTVRATILNGIGTGVNYTKTFPITVTVPFVPVTDITGLPTQALVGTPLALTGNVMPSNAANTTIVWSVKDSGTTGAVITAGNMLNATSTGTVTLTATIANGTASGNYIKDFNISVIAVASHMPVTDITGVPTNALAGTPLTLTGTVQPNNATFSSIEWSVKEAGTTGAIITGNILNADAGGTATITAVIVNGTSVGANFIRDFEITVTVPFVAVTDITDIPAQALSGTPLTLIGNVTPANATNRTIEWSVINAGTIGAIITGNNTLNTEEAGIVAVRANINNGLGEGSNYTKDISITVASSHVAVVDITDVPANVIAGMPQVLFGNVTPANATFRNIEWSIFSAGTTGATITGNTLNTTAAGNVTVTAAIINGLGTGNNYIKHFTISVAPPFVAVTDITNVPTQAMAGTPLALIGNVVPADASNRTIIWSVTNEGTTGAGISGNTLNTTAAGTVIVTATISNGTAVDSNFIRNFTITVNEANAQIVPVTDIKDVPGMASAGIPLVLTGTVAPLDATFNTIVWTVANQGNTGASITGNTLTAAAGGVATVTATIINGRAVGENYTENFSITVSVPFIQVSDIVNVPTATVAGTPLTLTGTVLPANASNRTITWSIINPGTTGASIGGTNNNRLNTTAAGTVTVSATITNGTAQGTSYTKEFTIIVNAPFVAVTSIADVPAQALAGTPLVLTGSVLPANATNRNITWSVTNAGTTGAAISSGNQLNTTAAGTVTISATIASGLSTGNYTEDFTITVVAVTDHVPVTGITGIPTEAIVGTPLALTGTVAPNTATFNTIIWTVNNPGTTGASISGTNTLNATTAGTVSVTATITNGTAVGTPYTQNFDITVIKPVTGITLQNNTIEVNENLELSGTVLPNDATSKTITWSINSAGGTGAAITGGNIFRATSSGTAMVTATVTNGLGTGVNYIQNFPITVQAILQGSVSILGSAQAGNILTVSASGLGGSGAIGYVWERGDTAGGSFTAIAGATSNTYTLETADVGKFVRVTVTRAGFAGNVSSAAAGPITAASTPDTTGSVNGTITITDGIENVTVNFTNTGDLILPWDGELNVSVDGVYQSYRWTVDGMEIIGWNSPALTLNGEDYSVGRHRILVAVTQNGVPYSREIFFTVN